MYNLTEHGWHPSVFRNSERFSVAHELVGDCVY